MQVVLTYLGVVQGVGFRPSVYRLATELGLLGRVYNDLHGVVVELDGSEELIDQFKLQLPIRLPDISRIDKQTCKEISPDHSFSEFKIMISEVGLSTANRVVIPADLRVCHDCLHELNDPHNRRYQYPFTNCTNCGPRYSITKALPYDRCNTTMHSFTMCDDCSREYHDPSDRRYHAQPIACPACGPHVELHTPDGALLASEGQAMGMLSQFLVSGCVVALKGLGGYQLVCRADDREAVNRLRIRKHREAKPLAVMVSNTEEAHRIAIISTSEEALLQSHIAPIVLLSPQHGCALAPNVSADSPSVGVMLPTTPLHQVLMQAVKFPIVCTSANISDEPICIDDDEAYQRLGKIADYFLTHNRPILRHLDDSVAMVVDDRVIWLRSSRGLAPVTVESATWQQSMVGLGGHMKNSLTIITPPRSTTTQYLGDMDTVKSRDAQRFELDRLHELYPLDHQPLVIGDMHPDYHTPIQPTHRVQHHHAHIASVVLENGRPLPAFGVCWDATGYGLDGTIWGGEALEITPKQTIRRAHFRSFPLLGGDQAAKQTWRPLLGMLSEIHLDNGEPPEYGRFAGISEPQAKMLIQAIRSGSPARCSSVGRMFDAMGCLLHVDQGNRFEGDTPMRLQMLAERQTSTVKLPVEVTTTETSMAWTIYGELSQISEPGIQIDWEPMLKTVMQLSCSGVPDTVLARSFHKWLVDCLLEITSHIQHNEIVICGGCFQNRLLTAMTIEALRSVNKSALMPINHPMNDGGLSLGQCAAVTLSNYETE